eukprot:scaffold56521_cov22-Tisochrysis_lutea.AAC.1
MSEWMRRMTVCAESRCTCFFKSRKDNSILKTTTMGNWHLQQFTEEGEGDACTVLHCSQLSTRLNEMSVTAAWLAQTIKDSET